MLNAGQICLAPDYMLVPAEKETAVVAALEASVSAMHPGSLANPDCTSVVNDRHFQRLSNWLEDAREKGARLVTLGPGVDSTAANNGRKLPLIVILDATDEMIVMQEEIFGPLLPIRRYEAIDEAIAEINRRDHPLALYYFGTEAEEQRRVLDRTMSGGVTINDVLFHNAIEDLPFGGIGPSGMGAYHGRDGFRMFSHARAIFHQSRFDIARLGSLKPPYGPYTRKMSARQMKR